MIAAEMTVDQLKVLGKIRDLRCEIFAGKTRVIPRWDQQPVLIKDIQFINEIEKFVPSRITMGPQVNERFEESSGDMVGQSPL